MTNQNPERSKRAISTSVQMQLLTILVTHLFWQSSRHLFLIKLVKTYFRFWQLIKLLKAFLDKKGARTFFHVSQNNNFVSYFMQKYDRINTCIKQILKNTVSRETAFELAYLNTSGPAENNSKQISTAIITIMHRDKNM